MPTPKKGPRLGGSPAHQRRMLRNLATALFEHGRVTTTETRARLLRPYAEKLITKAKKGDLHNRRLVMRELYTGVDWAWMEETDELRVNKYPQHRLFTEIAEMFADRPGGYTRITKIGPRKGDNAPMAVIELVTEAYEPKAPSAKGSTTAAAPAAAEAETTEAEETPADEAPAEETETVEAAEETAEEAPAEESAEPASDEAAAEESADSTESAESTEDESK